MTLASVLAIAGLAALAAFTLAALTTAHLNYAQQHQGTQDALYLAEAALSQAIARINEKAAQNQVLTDDVIVPDDATDSHMGVVTFQGFKGFAVSVAPDGTFNSPATLVATGVSNGVTRVIEARISAPQFPYVIAAAGPFLSEDGLEVRGAASQAQFVQSEASGQTVPRLAANMSSNQSITVTQTAYVAGDVIATGAISLTSDSIVDGVIRTGSIALPDIIATSYDPELRFNLAPAQVSTDSQRTTDQTFSSLVKFRPASRKLTIQGNVLLQQALLYVDGDLEITGAVQGQGGIVVTGRTTLDSGADLSTTRTDLVALIGEGDVTLAGNGRGVTANSAVSKKYFQGMVYTRGNFTASNVTIAGVFIVGPPASSTETPQATFGGGGTPSTSGSTSAMTLHNVEAVFMPEAASLVLNLGSTTNPNFFVPIGFDATGTFVIDDSWVNGGALGILYVVPPDGIIVDRQAQREAAILAALQAVSLGGGLSFPVFNTPIGPPVGTTVQAEFGAVDLSLGGVPGPNGTTLQNLELLVQASRFNANLGRYEMTSPQVLNIETQTFNGVQRGGSPLSLDQADALAQQHGSSAQAMIDAAVHLQQVAVDTANQFLALDNPNGAGPITVDLTLNRFLGTLRPLRITSWRER